VARLQSTSTRVLVSTKIHPYPSRCMSESYINLGFLNFFMQQLSSLIPVLGQIKFACRENVVLLSVSLHANVIFIWEEVCGSYH
jgi:hypothetical protein